MIINTYYRDQILTDKDKQNPLFLKTIELEKEMDETLKNLGFNENDYKLYMSPTLLPNSQNFNAIFDLQITMEDNFGYSADYKEDIISLPNEEIIEMIIKEFVETTKKNLNYFQNLLKNADKNPEMDKYKNIETAMVKTLKKFKKYEK